MMQVRRPALVLVALLLLVSGASALDDYAYFQEIDYAGCDKDVYQQDIVIHRSNGTAYNETSGGLETWHIYVGDHCQEDYDDVRFTNSSESELAYYRWPDYTSSSAKFCVRLEGADEAGTLTVWYGNSTAATTSDGDTTYLFFDHFDGTSIDNNIWSTDIVKGKITVSNSIATFEVTSFPGYTVLISKDTVINPGCAIEYRDRSNGVDSRQSSVSFGSGGLYVFEGYKPYLTSGYIIDAHKGSDPTQCYIKKASPSGDTTSLSNCTSAPYPSQTTYYATRIVFSAESKISWIVNGTKISESTDSTYTGPMKLAIVQRSSDIGAVRLMDYCLVRAYSATPPAALTFSGEQETPQPFPGCSNDPTDPDADGLYEDINGNARWDFQDIILFFQHLVWCEANQPVSLFDWNSNGRCDFDDVFRLWSNGGMI